MLASLLTTLLFSVSAICATRATRWVGSTRANLVRLFIALACLALYANTLGSGWQGSGLFLFVVSGAIGIGLGDIAAFRAFVHIGPRLTVLFVQCLCAPFAAVMEWWWLGTALTGTQILGCSVILLGTGISMASKIPGKEPWRPMMVGGAFAVGAALAQAAGAVLTRRANMVNGLEGMQIDGMTAAYQRMCGAMVVMVGVYLLIRMYFSRWPRGRNVVAPGVWKSAMPWVVGNALSGAVLGIACFQWALQTTPSAIALSVVALTPLVIVPLAWILERDRPSLWSIFGGIVAVGGVWVLLWRTGSP